MLRLEQMCQKIQVRTYKLAAEATMTFQRIILLWDLFEELWPETFAIKVKMRRTLGVAKRHCKGQLQIRNQVDVNVQMCTR